MKQAPGDVLVDKGTNTLEDDGAVAIEQLGFAEILPGVFDSATHIGLGKAVDGFAADKALTGLGFAVSTAPGHKQGGAHDAGIGAKWVEW